MLEPQDGQTGQSPGTRCKEGMLWGFIPHFTGCFPDTVYGIPYFDASRVQKASVDFHTWLIALGIIG